MASFRIVGNKEYSKRQPLANYAYTGSKKIQNEVNVMSYYLKNRKAADEFKMPPYKLESGNNFDLTFLNNCFYYYS